MTLSHPSHIAAILISGAILTLAPAGFAQVGNGGAVTAAPQTPKVVEDIVARVNDEIITQSDYDRALAQMHSEAEQQGASPQDIDDRDKNLLRDLIDQQLLLSKGKDLGITGEAELVKRLDDIRKQNHLDSMEALEKAAQDQGVSYEDFKANIRNNIITQQVIEDEVSRHVQLSQADVLAYFNAHRSAFAQPETVHLREILIATPLDAAADSPAVIAAGQQAQSLWEKLKGGANFEELAKTSSSGPGADNGGDLGEFRRGMMAKQLEDQTFSLKPGQFTEPIRTKQGFVILEVAGHTAASEPSFKDVQQQVEEAVFTQQMQPALRDYLTKLREAAYIDIKPGFADTGASPDEIHPSYSAYVPPGPKKKKSFAKVRFLKTSAKPAANSAKTDVAGSSSATATGSTVEDVQKPGKREKVRFGQAPQQSLPATESTAESSSARTTTPEVPAGDIGTVIDPAASAPAKQEKTRFSQRPRPKKVKNGSAGDTENTPTQDELAAQKVQDAPLGLAGQPAKAKKKQKSEKTRYTAKPKQPQQVQQPYMGGQQPVDAGTAAQGAAGGAQSQPKTPAGAQP